MHNDIMTCATLEIVAQDRAAAIAKQQTKRCTQETQPSQLEHPDIHYTKVISGSHCKPNKANQTENKEGEVSAGGDGRTPAMNLRDQADHRTRETGWKRGMIEREGRPMQRMAEAYAYTQRMRGALESSLEEAQAIPAGKREADYQQQI